ncbi:MAG: heparinase II/III family protein [Rikenellaceae bacterium]|nr:heparinase II/III family protein [Rikenellaceae bacterium]
MGRAADYIQLFSNMGWRYISYRVLYELKRRSGWFKHSFPTAPVQKTFVTLEDWKAGSPSFFFDSRETLDFEKKPEVNLKEDCKKILEGKIPFFHANWLQLGSSYDWMTNPDSGFVYDKNRHWTQVEDYSLEAGDIKYVWEKSRFSFLYTVIRYDYHFQQDHSRFVFEQMEDWIDANPINQGPNYKCSQEISLRMLNWIFALYFYKHSPALDEKLFQKIVHAIYWQFHHVYHNIDFSRIAVRNNHAITETLAIYLIGSLFPWFPNAERWKNQGKKWLEEEIDYQIYQDGTFLQFSMNYHRVVVQLLIWAIGLADRNGEAFKPAFYEKAYKSVGFLFQCQEDRTGYLPNYGANDGALFFKLSSNDYRDYRPQLDALHRMLTGASLYSEQYEDECWYGHSFISHGFDPIIKQQGIISFPVGGYYLIRQADSLTFIRCGNHKDRPSHADNLHLDLWYQGENILPDAGSYKYNADERTLKYFMGTESHNSVMLSGHDQMRKGARFIWYDWTQCLGVQVTEEDDYYEFQGEISCFGFLSPRIRHQRIVRISKSKPEWTITDRISPKPKECSLRQIWHTGEKKLRILSEIEPEKTESYYSSYYGRKEAIDQYTLVTDQETLTTTIRIDR